MFSPLHLAVSHITRVVWWPMPCCIWPIVRPGERGDLAPIKLVSTLHFNLCPRGLWSLLRRQTLSGWDQEAIGARVTLTALDLRNWMKRMKNYTLSLDVLKFGNFSKADSGSGWGWIFKTLFLNENSRQTDYASSYCWCFRSLFIVNKSQRERTWHEVYALWEFRLHFIFMPLCSVKVQRTKFSVKRA